MIKDKYDKRYFCFDEYRCINIDLLMFMYVNCYVLKAQKYDKR